MARRCALRWCLAGAFSLVGLTVLALAAEADGPPLDFFVGSYAVIGQEPGTGAVYSGTASIEVTDGGLVMTRHIAGRTLTATGTMEVPRPPGEGRVLRFRWSDRGAVVMTCLETSDLDNYARLTCVWQRAGDPPPSPGLEALFPTAAWRTP